MLSKLIRNVKVNFIYVRLLGKNVKRNQKANEGEEPAAMLNEDRLLNCMIVKKIKKG
jgi:hypothetical protein